ncbi:Putative ribonuclease H protein At1g65750, partial [Linum perenne]
MRRTNEGLRPCKSKQWSSCWKGINEAWSDFTCGLQWGIRNGKRVNFWRERWLDDGTMIGDQLTSPRDHEHCVVADFCNSVGEWDLVRLAALLPPSIVKAVAGMTPPSSDLGDDILVWGLEPNCIFSIKSGYELVKGLSSMQKNANWKVWNWEGPQRIRHFLWVVSHDHLHNNSERRRRHLAVNDDFGVCPSTPETMGHNLRFDSRLEKRIYVICWRAATGPNATLNMDGSVIRPMGEAAAGGALRNDCGRVLDAFAANLGSCSITRSEISAIVLGHERAWNVGVRNVEIQTDSQTAIRMLSMDTNHDHQHATIMGKYKRLLNRPWRVSLRHIYREANHLDDAMASRGHELALGTHAIDCADRTV